MRSVPIEPVRPASLGSTGLPSAPDISQVPCHCACDRISTPARRRTRQSLEGGPHAGWHNAGKTPVGFSARKAAIKAHSTDENPDIRRAQLAKIRHLSGQSATVDSSDPDEFGRFAGLTEDDRVLLPAPPQRDCLVAANSRYQNAVFRGPALSIRHAERFQITPAGLA